MSPERRNKLIRLIFLVIIAIVLIVGSQYVPNTGVDLNLVIPLLVVGALIGFFMNRKK
jgi:hypothetical protein